MGELDVYFEAKQELKAMKAKLLLVDENLKRQNWAKEVLRQKYDALQMDRDEIYENFQKEIYAVKQKSNFKNLIVRKKIVSINESIEKQDASLSELISQTGGGSTASGGAPTDITEIKNAMVANLQKELERIIAIHNSSITQYEQKMVD